MLVAGVDDAPLRGCLPNKSGQKFDKFGQILGTPILGLWSVFFDSSFDACAPRITRGAHRVSERVAGQASSIQLMREQVSDRRLVLGREPAAPTPRFSLCRVKIPRPWLLAIGRGGAVGASRAVTTGQRGGSTVIC